MKYEPIYYFMNEVISLVEIKRNDLESTDKSQLYHWLLISKTNKLTKLEFDSMGSEIVNGNKIEVRKFKNAELRFDNDFAKFQIEDSGHILMNNTGEELPGRLKERIDNEFLSSSQL